jgi:predicted phosphodiesterase
MQISFDLISDLHLETWEQPLDFAMMPTSPICVVAGDVTRDRFLLTDALTQLGKNYQAVMYIDGNDEHRWTLNNLEESYEDLKAEIGSIDNVIYLQDNVAVFEGVGFVGTNGWWTYDFTEADSYEDTKKWFMQQYKVGIQECSNVEAMALYDIKYLNKSVANLQKHPDIHELVIVTHTVPVPSLINHDIELDGTYRKNCVGNKRLPSCLQQDTEGKVGTWVFGHYHGSIDKEIDGIRYVNNCRGRGDTQWRQPVYYPKRIEIDY